MKKISLILTIILILSSLTIFVGCVDTETTTTTIPTTTSTLPEKEEVRYTVTEEEWNAWTTYQNYTIEQYYGDNHLIHKYTVDALQFTDGNIVLFIGDKQYLLEETEEGYIATDCTDMAFSHGGLLAGGYVYDEFTYDAEIGAYVLDLVAEMGMIWEVRFENGVPVSVIYKEFDGDVESFVSRSYYTNVGTTVIEIPEYEIYEKPEDNVRYTVTEEEWNLNLNAGSYSGIIANQVDGEFLQYSYKYTDNAIVFDEYIIVSQGDKKYILQEADGVWYAMELTEGDFLPTVVPQGVNFSDYEYSATFQMYVPKEESGAEIYYSFLFRDGVLVNVLLQTTIDPSNPEYYEFMLFTVQEIGGVVIEIPDYTIME